MNSSFSKANSKSRESSFQFFVVVVDAVAAIRARTFRIAAFDRCDGVPI
jgi:hypothetical protein